MHCNKIFLAVYAADSKVVTTRLTGYGSDGKLAAYRETGFSSFYFDKQNPPSRELITLIELGCFPDVHEDYEDDKAAVATIPAEAIVDDTDDDEPFDEMQYAATEVAEQLTSYLDQLGYDSELIITGVYTKEVITDFFARLMRAVPSHYGVRTINYSTIVVEKGTIIDAINKPGLCLEANIHRTYYAKSLEMSGVSKDAFVEFAAIALLEPSTFTMADILAGKCKFVPYWNPYSCHCLLIQEEVEAAMKNQLSLEGYPAMRPYEKMYHRLERFVKGRDFLWADVTFIAATEAVTVESLLRKDIFPEELTDEYFKALEVDEKSDVSHLLQPGLLDDRI